MFGQIIVAYRQRLGLTQEALADRAGLSVRSLRELEAGRVRSPRKSSVSLLADALGLTGAERSRFCVAAVRVSDDQTLATSRNGPPVPAQLPADVRGFVGRRDALASLDRLVPSSAGGGADAVTVVAVSGIGGIGKTTLVVRWAHQVRDRFPDGQLYVNLRGYDADNRVVDPADALGGFLIAMGVPAQHIPPDGPARAGMFRTVTDGKRMLIVLDNARDAEQVGPLLPGTRTIMVVVTSRDRLTGLVASVGAHPLHLDVLTPDESRDLLSSRIGSDRVRADRDAAARIVDACAGLPLALTITAARAQQAAFPLAMIAADLTEAGGRLDVLDGDGLPGPSTVFSWSFHALSDPAAQLFRLLGLHPGPDFTVPAAASLVGRPIDEVRRDLRELHRASLVSEHRRGRFLLHDLVRSFASVCTRQRDPESVRRAAVIRLLDHYLHTARRAGRALHLPQHHPEPDAALPGVAEGPPLDHHGATAWMAVEHEVLLACVGQAAALGLDRHVCHLAYQVRNPLDWRAGWDDMRRTQQLAAISAERLGDPIVQGHAHHGIARSFARVGRYEDALTELERARGLFEAVDDTRGRCLVHWNLSGVRMELGQGAEALADATDALRLAERLGDERLRCGTLNVVGLTHLNLGDSQRALDYLEPALALSRLHSPNTERTVLDSLARAYRLLGRHAEATTCYRQALDLYRRIDDRPGTAMILVGLGDTYAATGDRDAAHTAWQQALDIYRSINHPDTDAVSQRLADD